MPVSYQIFDEVPFAVAVLKGPSLIIEYINQSNLNIWGSSRESVIGRPLFEVKPDFRAEVEHIHQQIYATGNRFKADEIPITIGGNCRYFQVTIDPVRDEEGHITGQIAVSIDVTQQVLFREKLEQSEEESEKMKRLYEAVNSSTPDLVYVFDLQYRFTYANPALLAMWGKSWEASIGKGLRDLGYEEWHAAMHEREIDEIIVTKKSVRGTVSFPHATLGNRIYDYLLSPVLNDQGQVEAIAGITRDISDQKTAEQALKKSEQHLEILRNAVPALIFYLDKEQRYTAYNDTFCKWFGVDRIAAIGKSVREFLGENAYKVVSPHLDKAYAGEVERFEIEAPSRFVEKRWLDIVYTPDKNDAGEVQGIIVLATDVTESKIAEMAVRESENRFNNLIRGADVGIIVMLGEEMVVSVVNEAYGKLVGHTVDELLGQPIFKIVPETEATYRPLLDKVLRSGESVYLYDAPYNTSSMEGYLNVIYQPYREANGNITGVIALLQNITEQVIDRKNLQEANERASLAIESGELGTVEVNLQTQQTIISSRMEEIFEMNTGTTRAELIDRIHPDDKEQRRKAYEKAEQDGYLEYEARVIRNNGSIRWIKAKGRIYFDHAGLPLRLVAVVQDITDQKIFAEELERQVKQRTEELQKAHDHLQLIINLVSAPLQVLVPIRENENVIDFTYKLTNTAYAAYTVFKPEELTGKKVGDVFPGYFSTDSFKNIRQVAMTGISNTWENQYSADGLNIFNLMSAAMLDEDVVVHQTDFTKLKSLQLELQRKLVELERSNESLEEFAHASSHDLKEPIRKIQVFTDQLKGELSEQLSDKQLRLFQRIENASKRMASLIDNLLLYSQVSERPLETESVNLNDTLQLVQEDLELVISQKAAQIHSDELPVINGYKRQLQQLFQNLVSNAIKYSKDDVAPVIKIHSELISGKSVHLDEETMYYRISVEDNGIGFEQKYAEQIFQMFQRLHAKNEYSGTGLGLSIAKRIVDNHRGKITADSIPGEGATFYLYLPA